MQIFIRKGMVGVIRYEGCLGNELRDILGGDRVCPRPKSLENGLVVTFGIMRTKPCCLNNLLKYKICGSDFFFSLSFFFFLVTTNHKP